MRRSSRRRPRPRCGPRAPRTRLGAGATYYEAFQADRPTQRQLTAERDGVMEARDFRSVVPSLRALQGVGEGATLGLPAGYRWFVYMPLRDYDFQAPVLERQHRRLEVVV